MVRGLYVQHFEVVVDDRSLGSVTQLATGKWMAQVSEDRRFGPFDTPTEARQAVVGWHADRTRQAAEWREHSRRSGNGHVTSRVSRDRSGRTVSSSRHE